MMMATTTRGAFEVMGRLGTLLKWLILLPVLIAVGPLAVANDQTVTVHFNPFDTADPFLEANAPLYQVVFAIFALGVLVGGIVVWTSQIRHRGSLRRRDDGRAAWEVQPTPPTAARNDAAPPRSSAYLPRPERS